MTDSSARLDAVAEAMADADDGIIFGLLTPDEADFYRRMAQAAIDALGLTQVEQWVPVTESGDRWEPRSEASAKAALVRYPVGIDYQDGYGGVTHIQHESRLVSPWVRSDV